jgi:hypothetical protein
LRDLRWQAAAASVAATALASNTCGQYPLPQRSELTIQYHVEQTYPFDFALLVTKPEVR